jgi:hypothetical protein
MEFCEVSHTKLQALPGSSSVACIREAISYAFEFDELVLLQHNETTFRIDPRQILRDIPEEG